MERKKGEEEGGDMWRMRLKTGDRSREKRKAREAEINKKEIKEREGGERCM